MSWDGEFDEFDDFERRTPWYRHPVAQWVVLLVVVALVLSQIIGRFG